ncbi:hypothetical protein ACWD11_22610 [Streptomyces sp. NPDC002776]
MTREERRQFIRRQVDDWPPFTPQQRARLAVLLRPDPRPAADSAAGPRKAEPKAA